MQEHYEPTEIVAYDVWSKDDVLSKARELKIYMTKEQVDEALESVDQNKSADLGITWYTIESVVESFGHEIDCDDCSEYFSEEEKSKCNSECWESFETKQLKALHNVERKQQR
jgi:hypothetical protein